jgi:solute carrier family 5 (sodium-coupled monocarboxylate transporter), member 8/12
LITQFQNIAFQGGLQAVVWTDVIQTIIMFGAVVLVAVKGTLDIGGLGVVLERNWNSGRIEAAK